MNEFNTYLNNLDYSFIKDLCERKGKVHTYRKGDFFIRQNEKIALFMKSPAMILLNIGKRIWKPNDSEDA